MKGISYSEIVCTIVYLFLQLHTFTNDSVLTISIDFSHVLETKTEATSCDVLERVPKQLGSS